MLIEDACGDTSPTLVSVIFCLKSTFGIYVMGTLRELQTFGVTLTRQHVGLEGTLANRGASWNDWEAAPRPLETPGSVLGWPWGALAAT